MSGPVKTVMKDVVGEKMVPKTPSGGVYELDGPGGLFPLVIGVKEDGVSADLLEKLAK